MDIAKLKNKRNGYVLQLKNFENFMKDYDSKLNNINDLECRIPRLEECYNNYMIVYQNMLEIIPETNENELELVNENFVKFESQYFNVKSSCNQLLQKYSGELVNLGAKNTASSNNIRLPEIKLKRFDGSLNDWLRFKDSFVEIIINNKSLSDIQRLYYLTGYLEGNAKAVIDSVQFSTDGFKIAWETLMLRYDNKRAIIEQHISNLVNLQQQ